MSFKIENIVRQHLLEVKPYEVMREKFLDNPQVAFLDNCENNLGSPVGKAYLRYPTSSLQKIKNKLATINKVKPEQLAVGNGSDELIDLLIRAFCEPKKDSILICEPTFSMYKIYAQINNVKVQSVLLNKETFAYNIEEIVKAVKSSTKIVFICSPNNPTGTSIPLEQLNILCKRFNGLVVVDEAYVDFSDKGSALSLLSKKKNLVVLQTFSKAWGLASLRIGVLYASQDVAQIINKIKPPYNVNGEAQRVILKAIDNPEKKQQFVKKILIQKEWLSNQIKQFSFFEREIKTDGNYLFIKVQDADRLTQWLQVHNILISNRSSSVNCKNFVRISVGTPAENKRLINLLKKFE